jgi:hypothetical protein
VAVAQTQAPATDVYVNSRRMKFFTQSTILHEALHNLTGLEDGDLKALLGLASTSTSATDDINKQLEQNSCAANN